MNGDSLFISITVKQEFAYLMNIITCSEMTKAKKLSYTFF